MTLELLHAVGAVVVDVASTIPDPDPVEPPGLSGISLVFSYVKWIALICAGLALLIGAGILAWAGLTNRDVGSALQKIAWPFGSAILIGGAIGGLATVAGV